MKHHDMTIDVPESMIRLLFEGCEMPEKGNELTETGRSEAERHITWIPAMRND